VAPEQPAGNLDVIRAVQALATAARLLERSMGDMTLPQYRVLSVVASSPERASRVAERAAVSRPSLSGVLDGLESRGWIRRSNVDGDRRGVHLDVTAAGAAALVTATAAGGDALAQLLSAVGGSERSAILHGLALLADVFEARAERREGSTTEAPVG
jgi:DNA-binding MarR family transcriptional regulator